MTQKANKWSRTPGSYVRWSDELGCLLMVDRRGVKQWTAWTVFETIGTFATPAEAKRALDGASA